MLQIIGWLGCTMLAVKLLEMGANPAMRGENGSPKGSVLVALLVGWAGVFGFAIWLLFQGSAMPMFETEEQRLQRYGADAAEAERIADCIEASNRGELLDRC
jgi:hypothetical protein